MSLHELLEGRRVVVCAGSGGVGKTTLATALALTAASRGARVALVTIDPARRLAGALGLSGGAGAEHRVPVDGPGELWAMTLDPKATWDALVRRHAPDSRAAEAVLANRIYHELSTAVAGSQEYMAAEKLWELHDSGAWDLVVLDTPPARDALDFLDAPRRLAGFVDSTAVGLLLAPSRMGFRLMGRGGGMVLGVLERVTGAELLRDLADFLAAFGALARGFRDRAERVEALLAGDEAAFVVVASPRHDALEEALAFRGRLRRSGLPFGAAVVNGVHPEPAPGLDATSVEAELRGAVGPAAAAAVAACLRDQRALAERDRRAVAGLAAELEGELLVVVPALPDGVDDLAALAWVGAHVLGAPERAGATPGA